MRSIGGRFQPQARLLATPSRPERNCDSYRFDDDGTPAYKEYLIREGLLLRPLGGALSQFRSGAAKSLSTSAAPAASRAFSMLSGTASTRHWYSGWKP